MNQFQKDIITIIYSALTNSKSKISSSFSIEKGAQLAKKHNISTIFYEGALLCGIPADNPTMKEMFLGAYMAIAKSAQQLHEIDLLTQKFDENKIDYMLLKGSILKQLYPKPEMRSMGDADILIKVEQYDKISEILSELGFTFKCETDHELVWEKKTLFLELHKSVMTTYNKDFYEYFNTGWEFAKKTSEKSTRYELKREDFFIYLFIHFTKHYRISGIGIKHLIDLWVYKNLNKDMDENYIIEEIDKLKLREFYHNVNDTIDVWFNEKRENEKTNLITDLIFSSGQYGSQEMSNINRIIREMGANKSASSVKTKKVFKIIFLPYNKMCEKFSILKKLPILLPIMWCVRLFDIMFCKKEKLAKYRTNLKKVDKETIDEHQWALNFVGLKFKE